MDQSFRQAYLDEHIPYRMRSVDGLRWACEALQLPTPHRATLMIDGLPRIDASSIRFLTNPLVESGAIAARVLLEFMCIKLDRKTGSLCSRGSSEPDDLTRVDFGLIPLDPVRIARAPGATEACIRMIQIANKGIAHLTGKPPGSDDVSKLHHAARVVPLLVCESVYDRLGIKRPEFAFP